MRRTGRAARPTGSRSAADATDDFVIVGFTAPKGSRGGFGALHLAQYVGWRARLRRASAGSGFSDRQLAEAAARARRRRSGAGPPATDRFRQEQGRHAGWSRELVCEVRFTEGPTTGCSGSRCSCGFGTTRSREECCPPGRRVGVARRMPSRSRRYPWWPAHPRPTPTFSASRTSTRSSGPTRSTPRAT